jgi:hypothetical protein
VQAARLQAKQEEAQAASRAEKRLLGSVAKKVSELEEGSGKAQAEQQALEQRLQEAGAEVELALQHVQQLRQRAGAASRAQRQELQQLEVEVASAAAEVEQRKVGCWPECAAAGPSRVRSIGGTLPMTCQLLLS